MTNLVSRESTLVGTPSPGPKTAAASSTAMAPLPDDDTEDATIKFVGPSELYHILNEIYHRDFIVVKNVLQGDFDRIEKERERRRRKVRFFFLGQKHELRVTVPSGYHERAHANLFDAIRVETLKAPPMPPWSPSAASKYWSPDGKSSKEGDAGGYPEPRDPDGGDARWPALVIECGMSQSVASLHAAMQWWFRSSEHRVKIVLLVKLYRPTQTIMLEKFTEEHVVVTRPGATATRSSAAMRLQPVLQQTIHVAPVPNSNPTMYRDTRGALVLAFELLYRRMPGPDPGDRDVVVSQEKLEQYAFRVWQ